MVLLYRSVVTHHIVLLLLQYITVFTSYYLDHSWVPGMYLFNTKEDCCKQALDSDDCDYVAICATDPPTGRPTTTRPSLEPSSSQVCVCDDKTCMSFFFQVSNTNTDLPLHAIGTIHPTSVIFTYSDLLCSSPHRGVCTRFSITEAILHYRDIYRLLFMLRDITCKRGMYSFRSIDNKFTNKCLAYHFSTSNDAFSDTCICLLC